MSHMWSPLNEADLTLADGRNLRYAVWGDPAGRPLFLFHGSPGSRYFVPDPGMSRAAGVRLITVDRPGFGRSDPSPGRRILDWPADIRHLADTLALDAFDVAGHSSGGPYALACAHDLPDRVSRVALVSCVGPPADPPTAGGPVDQSTAALEREAAAFADSLSWLVDDPERFLQLPRPAPDLRVLADPVVADMFLRTLREAVRQGVEAYGWDCVLEAKPWGFPLGDIGARVWIFHGDADAAVPRSDADHLAAQLPNSVLRMVPDAGHGLLLSEWPQILTAMQVSA